MKILLLFIIIAASLALVVNLSRYFLPSLINRLIINLSTLLLIIVPSFFLEISPWLILLALLIFHLSMTYYFKIVGAIIALIVALSFAIYHQLALEVLIEIAVIYIGFFILFQLVYRTYRQQRKQKDKWISQLMKQSKQLHIYREIGTKLQETLSLEKHLSTILTAVTAGHGLGFNRAMIFLKEQDALVGRMAIGPRTAEEGFHIWEDIAVNKYKFTELIEIKQEIHHSDLELNDIVQTVVIPLSCENTSVSKVLKSRTPMIVKDDDGSDDFQQQMKELFHMEEFAIVPLIHKGNEIGIIVIDNIVNKKPIKLEDLEGVLPFANQAAIGIEQAKLYEKMEQLAKRDGLTGLYNQRSLQESLRLLFQNKEENWPVSLIMIDIDYFKHFNDRNGHLLGNEVLIEIANLLESLVGNGHSIYRFGGEELSIVMPNSTIEDAFALAEKIRRKVWETPFPEGEHQPLERLTISLGVACTGQLNNPSKEMLIHAADEALYDAKNSGKNKTAVYKGGK